MAALAAVLLIPFGSGAEEAAKEPPRASVGNIIFDVMVARPLSAVTVAAGSILFLPAAALSAVNGGDTTEEAYDRFVGGPGEYLWGRPLGEF